MNRYTSGYPAPPLGHDKDIGDFEEPMCGHNRCLVNQPILNLVRCLTRFVSKAPRHRDGAVDDETRLHFRPSAIRSLTRKSPSRLRCANSRMAVMACRRL